MALRLLSKSTPSVVRTSAYRPLYTHTRSIHNPGFKKYSGHLFEKAPGPGLTEPFPGTPETTEYRAEPAVANVTTLSNGARVASLSTTSPVASFGVYITKGSRHESRDDAGFTHFLQHLAFKSTVHRYAVQLVRDIEDLGGSFAVTAGREHLLFESEVLVDNARTIIPIMGDVLNPRVAFHEVERQKHKVEEATNDIQANPLAMVLDLVHREAFRSRGLGKSVTAQHNVHHITEDNLSNYVAETYVPSNMVIVGAGIGHEELVDKVQKLFFSSESLENNSTPIQSNSDKSKYAGGEVSITSGGDTHIAIAFEGLPTSAEQKDVAALMVLQRMLGAGVQRRREGPHMLTSRLNKNLVAPHTQVKGALAFNLPYTDSGLFGVYAQVEAKGDVSKVVDVLVGELSAVAKGVEAEELNRAKVGFKTDFLFSKRSDLLRFIGEQAVAGKTKISTPQQFIADVDAVTTADISRVARRVFSSRPTVVAVGDVHDMLAAEAIQSTLSKSTQGTNKQKENKQ